MSHLNNTNFIGASGPVRFSGADRTGIINIHQYITNSSTLIGQYIPDKNISERLGLNISQVRWVTGDKPTDGRQCKFQDGKIKSFLIFWEKKKNLFLLLSIYIFNLLI